MSIESDMSNPHAPAERNVYRMMNMKFLVRYATRQGQAIIPVSSQVRSLMPIVTYTTTGRGTMTPISAGLLSVTRLAMGSTGMLMPITTRSGSLIPMDSVH